jgi:hypothetical protein
MVGPALFAVEGIGGMASIEKDLIFTLPNY